MTLPARPPASSAATDDHAETGEAERHRRRLAEAQLLAEDHASEQRRQDRRTGGEKKRVRDCRRLHADDEGDRAHAERQGDQNADPSHCGEARKDRLAAPRSQNQREGAGDAEAPPGQELPGIETGREPEENAGEAPGQPRRQHEQRAGRKAGMRLRFGFRDAHADRFISASSGRASRAPRRRSRPRRPSARRSRGPV